MATERASKLFPTAGEAHRYCQSHGLDISMANDQLWDIAEALYYASNQKSFEDEVNRLKESRRNYHNIVIRWETIAAKVLGTDSLKQLERRYEDATRQSLRSIQDDMQQKVLDASNLIVKELPGVDARKELDGLQDVMTRLRDNQ